MSEVRVGQRWYAESPRRPMVVVAIEDRIAFVKRGDMPKKVLANPSGGYAVALSEFKDWHLIEDTVATREP